MPTVLCFVFGRHPVWSRSRPVSPCRPVPSRAMAVAMRDSVGKDVLPHDGRTADEKPGNVTPYADDGHRYPLSSFSHDGMAMVRKPGVTMPAFSALLHRATLSLVLSRNAPLMPSLPADTPASLPMPILMNRRFATNRHQIQTVLLISPYCLANW